MSRRLCFAALSALLLFAAPRARADVLDEFIEEQRESEQDEVDLPERKNTDAVGDQQCVEHGMEVGLTAEEAEEWCNR